MDEPATAEQMEREPGSAAREAAARARAAQASLAAGAVEAERGALARPLPPAVPDPIRFCVWTTVALLAWLLSPPVAAALFAAAGIVAYARAYRRGLRQSDCILRDVRLVMLYLALVAALGLAAAAWRAWALWHPR